MGKMVSDLRSEANSEQNEPNLFLLVSSPLKYPLSDSTVF